MFAKLTLLTAVSMAVFVSAAPGVSTAVPSVSTTVPDVPVSTEAVPAPEDVVPRALYDTVPTSIVDTSALPNPTDAVPSPEDIVPRSLYTAVPPIPTPTTVLPSTDNVVVPSTDVIDTVRRESEIDYSCNTGAVQCCNSIQDATSPEITTLLSLLGVVVGPITGQVGLTCSPISALAVGGGSSCTAQPVCCVENKFNGLVNLGCTPANIGL